MEDWKQWKQSYQGVESLEIVEGKLGIYKGCWCSVALGRPDEPDVTN